MYLCFTTRLKGGIKLAKSKRKKQKKLLLFAGLILILMSFVTEALILSLRYDNLWVWYKDVQKYLIDLEDKILDLNMSWGFFLAIMALYIVKCFFPIYTTSTVFFITGAVLPMKFSIPVNILGTILQFSIKYGMGYKFGAPITWKFISKNDRFRSIIDSGGKGNPYTLLAMRLIPIMPLNMVSSIYGSFRFGFFKYLGLSLVGFLPRIISFTYAGRNIFDPLSLGFLVPIMIITLLSGLTMLSANGVWTLIEKFAHIYKKKKATRIQTQQEAEAAEAVKETDVTETKEAIDND